MPPQTGHIQPLQLKPFKRHFCLKSIAANNFSMPHLVARARACVCVCVCVCVGVGGGWGGCGGGGGIE